MCIRDRDVYEMIMNLYDKQPEAGIYNVGTGTAQTFEALGEACFKALNTPVNIEYFDIPADLKDKYQNFTEADMNKWKTADLTLPVTSLEHGIQDYIQQYLLPGKIY